MKNLFLTQPYLLSLHPSEEMNIVWIQRQPGKGIVHYGRTCEMECTVNAECYEITGIRMPGSEDGYKDVPEENLIMPVWQCIAKITGLEPGEKIFYRCQANETATQTYYFHTAPKPGMPFKFAQLSDLQGLPHCDETIRQVGYEKPDFILYSGDAGYYSWRADQWFDLGEPWQDDESARKAFFPCMQQQSGAELMQYCPIFVCPGNHELDDLRVGMDKEFGMKDENWNWSVFMQLFRPLYPDPDTTLTGKRWYSVDYGDMHIISLSIVRWAMWGAYEAPGWRLVDSIAPGSPQSEWLRQDLDASRAKYRWVIQHWHLLNKGTDVQNNLCQPVINEKGEVSYPEDHGTYLMELFEKGGVNAVSYGHSHVYERYYTRGTHYIEAAFMSICYREEDAPLHPSGLLPIVEDNSRRSFLMVERKENGLFGTGRYVSDHKEIFDQYQIADETGRSVLAEE